MTYSLYNRLYLQACDSRTAPELVSDCGAASDVLGLYGDDLTALSRDLTAIWHVTHDGTRYIRTALKMTQRELSAAFAIPLRSIEDWERGARLAPSYVLSLLALAAGIYPFTVSNAGAAYFCDYCGRRWISTGKPEVCPDCGSYCVIEDTPTNARQSVEDLATYENKLIEQED
jgi:transcriptional regulator with XRE-family HTH domain